MEVWGQANEKYHWKKQRLAPGLGTSRAGSRGALCSGQRLSLRQWDALNRPGSCLETKAKRGRQERNSPSLRNASVILIPNRGGKKGLGTLPHCSPDRNSEVTTGQKAGALRIHGALCGPQQAPPNPTPEWLWLGHRGCCWCAHYCHTSSFWTPRKPSTVKPPAREEQSVSLSTV